MAPFSATCLNILRFSSILSPMCFAFSSLWFMSFVICFDASSLITKSSDSWMFFSIRTVSRIQLTINRFCQANNKLYLDNFSLSSSSFADSLLHKMQSNYYSKPSLVTVKLITFPKFCSSGLICGFGYCEQMQQQISLSNSILLSLNFNNFFQPIWFSVTLLLIEKKAE